MLQEANPETHKEEEYNPVSRANCELIFVRATRNQKQTGIAGAMCRGEFIEAVTRLS